ncbi:hypothetical protein LVJ94_22190 [Pendulispora rubella]|uniref:Uncharacterized protein n=1 Tax=Pendulispora rubella TaxID=2741070 RepID=A0ABZ2LLA9_9BACT
MLIPLLSLASPRKLSVAALAVLPLAACSSTPQATLALSVGGEADAFTRAPAPTTLVVDALDVTSGAVSKNLARAPLPASNIDLGDQSSSNAVRIRANGVDANGLVLVTGTSVALQLGALQDSSLPIFVQRTSEFARMPAPLSVGREAPVLANVTGRFVFVAGGSSPANDKASQLYDLGTLAASNGPTAMPRTPRSMAVYDTAVLLIDDAGASSFSLSNAALAPVNVTPPDGGTFAEVAGGITVRAPDATLYVVGATRASGPTVRILKVNKDGVASFASLTTARRGAAAVWVEGRGLVVAGGSDTGPGVEVLAPGGTSATPLGYASDATTGAGAAALNATHVLLGGGVDAAGQPAATRSIDLACPTSACTATTFDASKVPMALLTTQGFDLDPDSALFVGDDAAGLSHAFRVSTANGGSASEIPFKIPRRGARGIRVNPPAITFVGGDPTVESFTP